MSLEVGNKVGDYEIVSVLGAGGMGKVYKVRNLISDRVEAMKVLLPDLEHEPELADRFMREIKVQASLQHPNIAALHTALRVENQLLMIMELVEGVTLEERLRKGPIPLRDGVDYISQVLDALGYAHQHGVIHRDIKPANMMLTPTGVVKLMDFGIAKAAADRRLTITGTTMGSLYYMSPEQIQGLPTVDARSDLYSVGVSLYEIVTGKKPFDGDSQFAIMAAHLEKAPVAPVTLDAGLPQMLNDVIIMAIAKDAGQRFQSAQAFSAALGSVRGSLGMPAPAPVSNLAATVSMPRTPVPPPVQPPPQAALAPEAQPEPAMLAAPTEQKSGKRWLWVTAGALATVLVLVAAIQFGPWRKSSANSGQPPAPDSSATATSPTPAPATAAPPPVAAPPGDQTAATPAPQTSAPPEASKATVTPDQGVQKPPVHRAARTAVPTAKQAAAPPPNAVAQDAAPSKPAPPAEDPAVLQDLREQLVKLASRVTAVRAGLQNLKRSQAASGMSLRGDMVSAESRMNSMFEGANSALNARDASASKKFLDSAEGEVEKLEKFLGL